LQYRIEENFSRITPSYTPDALNWLKTFNKFLANQANSRRRLKDFSEFTEPW